MLIGRWFVWTAAMLVVSAVGAAAQPRLSIPRTAGEPAMSPFLLADRPPARDGALSGFVQREPRDGQAASLGTYAYVSYDSERLHIVFVCLDEPSGVRARVTQREGAETDDSVSVYLDTFHDRRRAYVFSSNPLGVQSEYIKTEGQDDDPSFDTLWYTEASLTAYGYVVRMSIPFRSLRFSGTPSQTWGIAFSRRIQRLNEESFWPPVSKRVQGFVPQFAAAEGLERIAPGSNVQFTPYGVFTGARTAAGTDTSRRVGLDAKVGIGSAFVMDAAMNPDFSEVESDAPQVTVNERFEVLFPEKRTFFVENAGYFAAPIPAFFSRRILDPSGGTRLTGKSGAWITAGLVMFDRETPDRAAATAAVGTVRRELGRDAHVGVLATVRDTAFGANRVVSADGRWTLGDTWSLTAQVMRSATEEEGRNSTGTGIFAVVAHDSRHLDLSAQYTSLSPGFDASLGFIPRVDVRQLDHHVKYRWRPSRGPIAKYGPSLDGFTVWDHAGALTDWRVRPRFELELVGQTSFLVDHTRSFESIEGLDFRRHRSTVEFETERTRWWALSASYAFGTDVNRKPAAGQLPQLVERRSIEAEAAFRPGRHVVFSETYLRNQLLQPGERGASRTVLDNHIARTTANLHVSRTVSVRAILDYERVAPNPLFSAVRRKQPLSLDLLGRVELNPGTAVYVGYIDRMEPGRTDVPLPVFPILESTGRQAFVKVSWLFRY